MRSMALALALAASPAWAQSAQEEPQAAPGSIGYGMIEQANAEGVFELVDNGQVSLRHTRSGLTCHFDRVGGGRLIVFEPPANATPDTAPARGDDVGCEFNQGREQVRIVVTRYPYPTTIGEQITGVERAIRRLQPDATPYPGETLLPAADPLPPRQSTRFTFTRGGERMFTRASLARVGAWIVKLRVTLPAADTASIQETDVRASALFDQALSEILGSAG